MDWAVAMVLSGMSMVGATAFAQNSEVPVIFWMRFSGVLMRDLFGLLVLVVVVWLHM
jgi:hypothetical protein